MEKNNKNSVNKCPWTTF